EVLVSCGELLAEGKAPEMKYLGSGVIQVERDALPGGGIVCRGNWAGTFRAGVGGPVVHRTVDDTDGRTRSGGDNVRPLGTQGTRREGGRVQRVALAVDGARAADDHVVAGAAVDEVVARAADDVVVPVSPQQNVVPRTAQDGVVARTAVRNDRVGVRAVELVVAVVPQQKIKFGIAARPSRSDVPAVAALVAALS